MVRCERRFVRVLVRAADRAGLLPADMQRLARAGCLILRGTWLRVPKVLDKQTVWRGVQEAWQVSGLAWSDLVAAAAKLRPTHGTGDRLPLWTALVAATHLPPTAGGLLRKLAREIQGKSRPREASELIHSLSVHLCSLLFANQADAPTPQLCPIVEGLLVCQILDLSHGRFSGIRALLRLALRGFGMPVIATGGTRTRLETLLPAWRSDQYPREVLDSDSGSLGGSLGVSVIRGGVVSPEVLWHRRERLAIEHLLEEPNQEVRRLMLQALGTEVLLQDPRCVPVQADGPYRLYHVSLGHLPPFRIVRCTCTSTGRVYALRVPPGVQTCREAIAWTFSQTNANYAPLIET